MRKLKALPASHLDRLVRENKPIYVMNTSALPSGDKGMVIINFFDGVRREFFKMPPTFIPMAITDIISPQKLLDSKDFKQTLVKGMLTLIEPSSAEAYLATKEAQDEYESLVLSEHSTKAQNIDINKTISRRASYHSTNEGHGPVQDVSAVDTVSNKVRGIIESLVANTINEKEALIQLRRHQSALAPIDFSYVVSNVSNQEIKKWANAGLARTSRAVEEEEEEVFDDEEDIDYDNDMDDEEEIVKPTKIKKNRGRPKSSGKIEKEKGPEKVKSVTDNKNYSDIFDFRKDPVNEMTPEDLAADEKARAMAMAQQNVGGTQTMYQQTINEILSGKV